MAALDKLPEVLAWQIELAKKGDGADLARRLLSDEYLMQSVPHNLREFLAGIVTQKIKLSRPLKRTLKWKDEYGWRERGVVNMVDYEMHLKGRLRDEKLRTRFTKEWCERYKTTPNAVASYLKHPRKPRRVTDRPWFPYGKAAGRSHRRRDHD